MGDLAEIPELPGRRKKPVCWPLSLRCKCIAHEHGSHYEDRREIMGQVGSIQHPMVKRDVVGFVAHLIEDYADEWLWRTPFDGAVPS